MRNFLDGIPLEGAIFGRNKDEAYTLMLNSIGCGPFDGGCLIVAYALQVRLGGEICVLTRKDGSADHAVLRLGKLFFDADGMASEDEILQRFNENEQASCVGIREYDCTRDLPDAARMPELTWELCRLITIGG